MVVEVLFKDRIQNFSRGQIAELEDGAFLRALINGGKVEVLNPPDWYPGKEEEEDGKSNNKQTPDGEDAVENTGSSKKSGRQSRKSVEESTGTGSEDDGGLRQVSEGDSDGGGGEDGISDSI